MRNELQQCTQRSTRRGDSRRLAIIVAAITAVSPVCASAQERLASSMGDVQAHFADCFRPPHDADGSLITFYFSLTRAGQVYGRPRVVLLGFNGSPESRRLFMTDSLKAFNECLPIPLNEELARTIPGKVYFLQFNVRASGDAILRPYGSHGGSAASPLWPGLRRGGIHRSW
jgi:hypothetical protein